MVQIAERVNNLPQIYLFRELATCIKQAKDNFSPFIRLHIGTPDLPTPYLINNEIALTFSDSNLSELYVHGYPDDKHDYIGLLELRESLAEDYKEKHGVDLKPDQFVIDFGGKPSLFNLPAVFLNHGDYGVVEDPSYPVGVAAIISATGHKDNVKYLQCTEENNFEPFLTDLAEEPFKRPKTLYLVSPNNPTGATHERKYLNELFGQAARYDMAIIYDAAYKDFTYGGYKSPSAMEFSDYSGRILEVGSFSKPYTMVGHRLGWVVGDEKLIEQWRRYKSFIDSGTINAIQRGGVVALKSPIVKEIVKNNMGIYERRAELLSNALNRLGLRCRKPKATPYIYFKIPEGFSSKDFCVKMINEAGVSFAWGSGFGPAGEGYARSTVFQKDELIEEALMRLEKQLG
ncbi:MAG TPA: aminotransferase class I/II-fold pyridoxal phosphate-dependent enzyme [archaeon]|nr:aminotransferase class I/II-fold pyridoxal phosphate-dependent enzyme [archaeon]